MNVILWMLGLVGVIWGYSRLWMRGTSGKIDLFMNLDHDGPIIAGDVVKVWVTLENRSWLAVPLLELSLTLPKGLHVQVGDEQTNEYRFRTYLLPRQRVKRRLYINCYARGLHRMHKAEVTFGDGTGLQTLREALDPGFQLLVRPAALDEFELPARLQEMTGEHSVVRWYNEDPSRLIGIRPYVLGDEYKHIHWAATAKTGELMSKQFDTTSDTTLYVVLNVQFFEPHWLGAVKHIVEYACRLAASLFDQAAQRGYAYGLCSNASWRRGGGQLIVHPERTPAHYNDVLSSLGELWPSTSCTFADLVEQLRRGSIRNGATIIIITAFLNDQAVIAINDLTQRGVHITVVVINHATEQASLFSPLINVIPIEIALNEQEGATSA